MADDGSKTASGTCTCCQRPAMNRCTGCLEAPVYDECVSRPTFYCSQVARKLIGANTSRGVESFKLARLLVEPHCFSKLSSTGFDCMPRHYGSSRCASKVRIYPLTDFNSMD